MNNRSGTATRMAYRTAAARTIIAVADEVGADQTHEQWMLKTIAEQRMHLNV
jgi:hypothetical protein